MFRSSIRLLAAVAAFAIPHFAAAQTIEIDWQIDILEPSKTSSSPQISLIMAGTPSLAYDYAEFRINPQDSFIKGGAALDVWWGSSKVLGRSDFNASPLSVVGDTINVTTRLAVTGSGTTYEIASLKSQNWGVVPQEQLPSVSTTILGKIDYSIDLTIAESEIELGANRVKKFQIIEHRLVRGNRVISRDSTPRVLYENPGTVTTNVAPSVIDNNTAY